jgi:hypothetical protein
MAVAVAAVLPQLVVLVAHMGEEALAFLVLVLAALAQMAL